MDILQEIFSYLCLLPVLSIGCIKKSILRKKANYLVSAIKFEN